MLEGLRRLEYRGYDSSGVAVLDGELVAEKAPAGSRTWTRRSRPTTPAASPAAPASGTPAGPPTARPPTATPTRTPDTDRAVAVIHNGIIENFGRCGPSSRRPASSCAARPTPRSSRTCWPRTSAGTAGGDLAGPMRQVCRRLDGAFTLVAAHRDQPGPAGRGPPQLAAGARRRRGRDVPGQRRRRVHRAHQGRGRARPGPGRRDHPGRLRDHRLRRATPSRCTRSTSTGTWPPPRRAASTTSCSRRSRSSRRRSPTRCCGHLRRTARSCWTSSGWTRRTCATSTRSSWSPAAPPTTPG